ncbi:hypothetical protein [Anaerosinus massiliensis]|uniref:hypothetical protein n=1 Tax=Massilibacillus massiliensis TaxID=1806837 RepID=UPI000DA62DAC|nr:hypothetical protein [Massilibacillus massiliensis]
MGSFKKKISKKIKSNEERLKEQSFPIYGSPRVNTRYKKYCWTEDWKGSLPKVNSSGCIYVLEKYYDIFQYILDRMREKKIKFVLFPIELYGEITGETASQKVSGKITDGTNFLMDEKHNVHAVCVKQYVSNIYDLMVLAHEVGHIYYGHKVRQEAGANYIKVNYKYEYDADWLFK